MSGAARLQVPADFGAHLRALREQAGLTQEQLSGGGLSKSYVSLLEAGRRTPTADTVARLAQALGVSAEVLLGTPQRRHGRERELAVRFAELALRNGDARSARDSAEQLVRDAEAEPDPELARAQAQLLLGRAHERLGELDQAVLLLESVRQVAVTRPADLPWLEVVTDLARCYKEAGDLHRAVAVAEEAVAGAASLGLQASVHYPRLVVTLAGASRERGDHAHAAQLLTRLLLDTELTASRRDRGSALWNASIVAAERGEVEQGILLAERALALFAEEDDDRAAGVLRTTLAWMMIELGDSSDRPLGLLVEARERLLAAGLEVDTAYAETELSRVCAARGDALEAVRWAESSLSRLQGGGGLEGARARLALAEALAVMGEAEASRAELARGAQELERLDAGRQAAAAWRDLAEQLTAQGDVDGAHRAFEQALRLLGLPGTRRTRAVQHARAVDE